MNTNEWGQLKKVIVGVADHAKIPKDIDISLRCVNFADKQYESHIQKGPYPQRVIDEANQDLETFVDFLKGESVEVVRPERSDCDYYNYCPRDSVFIHGDLTLATPMPIRARHGEWKAFRQHLTNPIEVPCHHESKLYNIECIGNKELLALTESKPAFDAANIIRADDNLLYLVSNSGNKQGARLLQDTVGDRARVHLLEDVYSYMHIDSTVAFLRDGLLLANPSRIKTKDDLPDPFRSWDIIWCPEPVDIGHYPGWCNASRWINMNLFSVNSNLVVLEQNQEPLRKALEAHGIECAMLPIRHQRTLGGGFHCVTLDVKRDVH